MKNLKKLVIASFMLVIAFVAVVSSTYAWFTQGTEASVNNITIGVVDAEKSLLISKDGTTWAKGLAFDFANKQLTPTTIVTDDGSVDHFNKLMWDDNLNPYLVEATEMEESTVIPQNVEHLEGFIKFDLYFQIGVDDATKWATTTLNMDLNALNALKDNTPNALAISSFRLAVAEGANDNVLTVIESYADGEGRYNSGSQFVKDNGWMALCAKNVAGILSEEDHIYTVDAEHNDAHVADTSYAHGPLVELNGTGEGNATGATAYQLKAVDAIYGAINEGVYSTTTGKVVDLDNGTTGSGATLAPVYELELGANSVNPTTYVESTDHLIRTYHLVFYVWMEGWDGDCVNAASAVEYMFNLKFKVK